MTRKWKKKFSGSPVAVVVGGLSLSYQTTLDGMLQSFMQIQWQTEGSEKLIQLADNAVVEDGDDDDDDDSKC